MTAAIGSTGLRARNRLGIAALFGHCQHPVADLQTGHSRSERRDHAGRALAGGEGKRREKLVCAAEDQEVDVIDRRGMYPHQHFIGPRQGLGNLADAQPLRRPN